MRSASRATRHVRSLERRKIRLPGAGGASGVTARMPAAAGTPEEFGAFIRNEVAQNIRIAKAAGINVE